MFLFLARLPYCPRAVEYLSILSVSIYKQFGQHETLGGYILKKHFLSLSRSSQLEKHRIEEREGRHREKRPKSKLSRGYEENAAHCCYPEISSQV